LIPLRYTLNFFKAATFLWIIFLMWYFNNRSAAAYLYLLLHGSYGLAWVIKDVRFGDARFTNKAAIGSHLILIILLIAYWMIPVPLMSGYGLVRPSWWLLSMIVLVYVSGVTLMVGSDYQKNTTLQKKKGKGNSI